MTPIDEISRYARRLLDNPRAADALRIVFLGALLALPAVALAYPGEQMVTWARSNIVAPLCFLAIAVSVCVALVRPQMASIAVWVTVISLFLMWILSNGQSITSQLQNSN